MNRRKFIKMTTAASAAAGVLGSTANVAKGASPNRKINVAIVGTNNRGRAHVRGFVNLPDVEVTYICDIDDEAMAKGLQAVEDGGQSNVPKGVNDFRRALEDDTVDAISFALPIHWHTPASILALKAGKHVYVEKPCSHNPREGELLVAAAKKYNRVVQMGNQRRSYGNVIEAMHLLKEGIIGRTYYARCWYASGRGSIGYGKVGGQPPSHIDYDLWQGPAPRMPYNDNFIHYNWHWFWHYGGGELANNGIHFLDLGRLGLGTSYPVRVSSSGGRYHYNDEQQTPDTQIVTYDFPEGKSMTWEALSSNRGGINGSATGVTIHGDNGYMSIDGNQFTVYDKNNEEIRNSDTATPLSNQDNGIDHFGDFIRCIKEGGTPRSNIEDANKSVHLCHLGNIAQRAQRSLNVDPHNGRIVGDREAMSTYWGREYEPGWEPFI
ncbi:MAG: Gfo/Idh/MocA family oxidoreductase [Balneolales bacterium]